MISMLAAAEELAKQKREQEKVMTNEPLIAKALLAFEKNANGVSFEEQQDLLRLLVRQVRVDRLDPIRTICPPVRTLGRPKYELTGKRPTWISSQSD